MATARRVNLAMPTGKRKRIAVSGWTHYETGIVMTQRTHRSSLHWQGRFLTWLFLAAAVAALGASIVRAAEPAAAPPGKKLYETKCLRCHKDLDPTIYEDMTWKRWLWKMKDKARLDNEEYGDLSDYLKSVREAAKAKKAK
jgi:hypothetical protein